MKIASGWLTKTARMGVGFGLIMAALSTPAWAVPHIPEIDPASMGSALTLLFAGAMVIGGKFRKS